MGIRVGIADDQARYGRRVISVVEIRVANADSCAAQTNATLTVGKPRGESRWLANHKRKAALIVEKPRRESDKSSSVWATQ